MAIKLFGLYELSPKHKGAEGEIWPRLSSKTKQPHLDGAEEILSISGLEVVVEAELPENPYDANYDKRLHSKVNMTGNQYYREAQQDMWDARFKYKIVEVKENVET